MESKIKFLNSTDEFVISLENMWGSDEDIANIASISYGNKAAKNTDGLIKMLLTKGHLSPFEHAGITFYLEIPIFVARQLLRYRHISANEMSRRYTTNKKVMFEFYLPKELYIENDFCCNDTPPAKLLIIQLVEQYEEYIKQGVRPELARIILPVNLMTKMYISINVRELMHILSQRLDPTAQIEIQAVAKEMYKKLKKEFPITEKYFKEVI